MEAIIRAAQRHLIQSVLRRDFPPHPLSSFSAVAAPRTVPKAALFASGSDLTITHWSRRCLSPPPFAASKTFPVGLTFSLALVTMAEAKEQHSPERIPRGMRLAPSAIRPRVNPLSKKEIEWSDYKKVPILVVDGEQLINSSDIVRNLDFRLHPEKVTDDEEAKWIRWVDDHLVHMLAPNIYRTTSEALESFDYTANNERLAVKYAGAAIMFVVSKKLKNKYGITDERTSLYEAAETWITALNGRDFLGRSRPNLADLAVFHV